MSLKLFNFMVENTRTKEVARFSGQGETLEQAWKEALKNANESFRPSSSGVRRPPNTVAVDLPSGFHVSRELDKFEGDTPFDHKTERKPEHEI